MVRLQLSIRAELENVTYLRPAQIESYGWMFTVKCNSCFEQHPKLVTLSYAEERPVTSGKGSSAHFVWKCGNCKRESSAKMEPMQAAPLSYSSDSSDSASFSPLLIVECRGLEFTGFEPQGIWRAEGIESGAKFDEIEFEDGCWSDYDLKSKAPVSVQNIEAQWGRAL